MSKRNRVKARDRAPLDPQAAWRRWCNDPVNLYGTEVSDVDPAVTFEQRSGRCYELCSWAVTAGTAPAGSVLTFGTWQGPGARFRIGHAWVVLPDGHVWEPIAARVHDPEVWAMVANPVVEVSLTREEAATLMLEHGHYGPWHEPNGATRHSDGHVHYVDRVCSCGTVPVSATMP